MVDDDWHLDVYFLPMQDADSIDCSQKMAGKYTRGWRFVCVVGELLSGCLMSGNVSGEKWKVHALV